MTSTEMTLPGLELGAFERLLAMLDECSQEQLETVRLVVTGALVNYPTKEKDMASKTEAQPELFPEKSQALAMELWDAMKSPTDPAAAELPDETLERITNFAKEIRNRTLEEISKAVQKAYSKFTETVVADIRKQKE